MAENQVHLQYWLNNGWKLGEVEDLKWSTFKKGILKMRVCNLLNKSGTYCGFSEKRKNRMESHVSLKNHSESEPVLNTIESMLENLSLNAGNSLFLQKIFDS